MTQDIESNLPSGFGIPEIKEFKEYLRLKLVNLEAKFKSCGSRWPSYHEKSPADEHDPLKIYFKLKDGSGDYDDSVREKSKQKKGRRAGPFEEPDRTTRS